MNSLRYGQYLDSLSTEKLGIFCRTYLKRIWPLLIVEFQLKTMEELGITESGASANLATRDAIDELDNLAAECEDTDKEDYQDIIDSARYFLIFLQTADKTSATTGLDYFLSYVERWLDETSELVSEVRPGERLQELNSIHSSPLYRGELDYFYNLVLSLKVKGNLKDPDVPISSTLIQYRFK
ncbi:MAG: hypothetical protein ABJ246_13015 [Paracoccaceae bacterium]